VFGPRVQLKETNKRPENLRVEISDRVTRMDIDGVAQDSDFGPGSGDGPDVDDPAAKHGTSLEIEDVLEAEAAARTWRTRILRILMSTLPSALVCSRPSRPQFFRGQTSLLRPAAAARGGCQPPAAQAHA
jgi:hypothetical protein